MDQGGDDNLDSDANPGTGQTALLSLAATDVDGSLDAGMYELASIGDFVWVDLDADGVQDGGEVGLDGVTVNLLDGAGLPLASAVTAGGGAYAFAGLVPGDYILEFVGPPGLTFSPVDQGGDDTVDSDANPLSGRSGVVTLMSGDDFTTFCEEVLRERSFVITGLYTVQSRNSTDRGTARLQPRYVDPASVASCARRPSTVFVTIA